MQTARTVKTGLDELCVSTGAFPHDHGLVEHVPEAVALFRNAVRTPRP
ncbi:MAG: hypothetical protein M3460_30095 [Actinomycetota bacterium]|nr:hypothetical protein [Actinomycetota bacterium]